MSVGVDTKSPPGRHMKRKRSYLMAHSQQHRAGPSLAPVVVMTCGRVLLVTPHHRTCDSDLGAPFRCAIEYRLLHRVHVCRMPLSFDAEHASVTYTHRQT